MLPYYPGSLSLCLSVSYLSRRDAFLARQPFHFRPWRINQSVSLSQALPAHRYPGISARRCSNPEQMAEAQRQAESAGGGYKPRTGRENAQIGLKGFTQASRRGRGWGMGVLPWRAR